MLENARVRLVPPLAGILGCAEEARRHGQARHARLGVQTHGLEAEEVVAELFRKAAAEQAACQQITVCGCVRSTLT